MSIRVRLAVWYGALFALILVVVIVLSYAFHARGHYEDVDGILVTTAGHTAAELETSDLPPLLTESSGGLQVTVRVYEADGSLGLASAQASTLPRVVPTAVMAAPAGPAFDAVAGLVPHYVFGPSGASGGAFGLVAAGGQRWRIYVRPVHRGGELTGYVESLAPLGQLDRAMPLFRGTGHPGARRLDGRARRRLGRRRERATADCADRRDHPVDRAFAKLFPAC